MRVFLFQNLQCREQDGLPASIPDGTFLWLDLRREELEQHLPWLSQAGLEIDPDHVADANNPSQPPYHDGTEAYDMIIVLEVMAGSDPWGLRTTPLGLFLTERLVVTVSDPDAGSVQRVRDRLLKGTRVPREPLTLVHRCLTAVVEDLLALREPATKQLIAWQENFLRPSGRMDDWRTVVQQRRRLRHLETLCEQNQESIESWLDEPVVEVTDRARIRFADLQEHLKRVLAQVEQVDRDMESLIQLHFAATSHRANEIMKVFTVVAAVFLPLSLVAGIFGMNFDALPGSHHEGGFLAVIVGMIGIGAGMLAFFRHKGWI